MSNVGQVTDTTRAGVRLALIVERTDEIANQSVRMFVFGITLGGAITTRSQRQAASTAIVSPAVARWLIADSL